MYLLHINMYVCIIENTSPMNAEEKEKLIISLIKDDLINSKLVNALTYAGLKADDYCLHLNQTVFELLGYEEDYYSDEVFELYHHMASTVDYINISENNDALDVLALDLYKLLKQRAPKNLS